MPLPRLSETPTLTVDPRLERKRLAEARAAKSDGSTSGLRGSSGGSVGPDRTASAASSDPRRVNTPYSRSHSSRPPSAFVPHSMHAQGRADFVFCGSCQKFRPNGDFAPSQLKKARKSTQSATAAKRELNLNDFPKCCDCVNPLLTERTCVECRKVRPTGRFSEPMRANAHGAVCKLCQRLAKDPKDTMRRKDLEADPFAAYSSSEDDDLPDGESPAAGGGASSSSTIAAAWNADAAYGVGRALETVPEGGTAAVVYDDDDEW